MSRPACSAPVALARLVEYWLGELDEANEALVDEHLLGCGECSENLQGLLGLAGGIRALVGQGAVRAVVSITLVSVSMPRSRWFMNAGIAIAARMPMMRMTTRSSTSVKPSSSLKWGREPIMSLRSHQRPVAPDP